MSTVASAARLVSLGKSAVRAIKKTLHKTRRSRPFTTVTEGCDRATALALLSGAGGVVATETTRYLRVVLTGDEATAWLRIQTPVGPSRSRSRCVRRACIAARSGVRRQRLMVTKGLARASK